MSLEQPIDERRELYDQFRAELHTDGHPSLDYDENALIMIYDQANDCNDDYVRLEVFMLAARVCPDSDAMAARKCYYYHLLGSNDAVADLLATHPGAGPLWRLMEIRFHSGSREQMLAEIDSLINELDDIDDETMIQIISIPGELGEIQWIKDHEEILLSKTTYPPSLYYEIYIYADTVHDNAYSIHALERLTEIEPFQVDYWVLLAELQIQLEDLPAALSAADYALAIDSNNASAIRAKAKALACDSTTAHALELEALLRPVIDSDDDDAADYFIQSIYSAALLAQGHDDEAYARVYKFIDNDPLNHNMVSFAVNIRHPKLTELLRLHYRMTATYENICLWNDWGLELYKERNFDGAIAVLQILFDEKKISNEALDVYYTSLYITRNYDRCAQLLHTYVIDNPGNARLTYALIAVGLLSYIRLRQRPKARQILAVLKETLPLENLTWTVSNLLLAMSLNAYLNVIDQFLDSRSHKIDDIDPFLSQP